MRTLVQVYSNDGAGGDGEDFYTTVKSSRKPGMRDQGAGAAAARGGERGGAWE